MGLRIQYIGFGTFDVPLFSFPFSQTFAPYSAVAATFKEAAISTTAPLNPGDSVTVQMLVNGLLVGTPVTLTDPDQFVIGSLGNIVVPAMSNPTTDTVYFRVTVAGAPPADVRVAVNYDAGGGGDTQIFSTGGFTYGFGVASDLFFDISSGIQVAADNNVIESIVQTVWPIAGKFKNLALWVFDQGNVTGASTIDVAFRLNGGDTALVVSGSINVAGNNIFRNDVDEVTVSAGDLITIRTQTPTLAGGGSDSFHGSIHVAFTPS